MKILKALNEIQTELKAPKNLYNSYGKYRYRNFEGICEAVKPLLQKTNTTLVVSDDVEQIGDRIYVKATAVLKSVEDESFVAATALAREPFDKKGMDDAQITGATSSYARKYCLNGLFLLDDTKDPDTNEYREESDGRADQETGKVNAIEQQKGKYTPVYELSDSDKQKKAVQQQIDQIKELCKETGVPTSFVYGLYKKKSLNDLTRAQANAVVNSFDQFVTRYKADEPTF